MSILNNGGETFESYENHPQHLDVCPKLLLDVRPKIVHSVCLACVKPEYIDKEGGGRHINGGRGGGQTVYKKGADSR